MIALYINDKPAIIKSGTTIKLTRENPSFTSAGDYTLDVVLPLSGCLQNLQIFGALQYRAVSIKFLAGKKFPFRLVTELLTLEGTAIVTNVTQDEVKVQLLAGNSALNFDTLGEDGEKYIDDLDLGRAYGDLWDRYHPNEKQTDVGTIRMLMSAPFSIEQTDSLLHGSVEETDCVCFPIWSDTDMAWANQHQYAFWGGKKEDKTWRDDGRTYRFILKGNESDFYPDLLEYTPNSMPYDAEPPHLHLRDNLVLAPQPYLCIIVERVLGALGYSLAPADNALHQGWMGQVFIANARGTLHFAGCVPHWTVKELFTELRNLFGVIVFVEGKRARVVSRNTLYTNDSAVEIRMATDERSTDIDTDGEQKETTSGNVGYAFTNIVDKHLAIGENCYEKMEVRRVADAELVEAFQTLTENEAKESNILFFATDSGKRIAIFYDEETNKITFPEVDQVGPLYRDEDYKVDTQLRIIPASMAEDKTVLKTKYLEYIVQGKKNYYTYDKFANVDDRPYDDFHVPYLITADTVLASSKTLFNLQTYIESEEDTTQDEAEKQEVMEVAINCGKIFTQSFQPNKVNEPDLYYTVHLPYPVGIPYYRSRVDDSIVHVPDCMQFLLHYPDSAVNRCLTAENLNIDTRVVRQITYYDKVYDPNKVYLINGRKYLCQKIEITLDDQGVQPLKKGYFYEIG